MHLSLADHGPSRYRRLVQSRLLRVLGYLLLLCSARQGIYLRWQRYQQLVNDTEKLLQQTVTLPKMASRLPEAQLPMPREAITCAPLTQLIQQITQLISQHDLRLLALHQPFLPDWEANSEVQLQVEIIGYYPALLAFLKAWVRLYSAVPFQEITLRQATAAEELILSLRLSISEVQETP